MRWFKRLLLLTLLAIMMPSAAQAVVVSRLQLDNPALGTAGGSALHNAIQNLYIKIGNSIDSRYFEITGLADTLSTDLEHNLKTSFTTLSFDVYSWNSGTGELTLLTTLTTPTRAQIAITATPSFLTTKTRVTNNSGAPRDLVVVIHHDSRDLDELADVALTSPAEGETLRYDASTLTWKNAFPSGGGGGGGSAAWFSPSGTGALPLEANGQVVYLFPDATDSDLVFWFQVPDGYVGGNQITMGYGTNTIATSGGYVMRATSYLVRSGTDAISETSNSHVDDDLTTIGSPNFRFETGSLDLTEADGEINGVAVSSGDMIKIVLTRNYADAGDTTSSDVRFVPGATTMRLSL